MLTSRITSTEEMNRGMEMVLKDLGGMLISISNGDREKERDDDDDEEEGRGFSWGFWSRSPDFSRVSSRCLVSRV